MTNNHLYFFFHFASFFCILLFIQFIFKNTNMYFYKNYERKQEVKQRLKVYLNKMVTQIQSYMNMVKK